jgi:uncharacterized protein (DUF362 family)/glycosyltransferase involved in cell wall biosynthesis
VNRCPRVTVGLSFHNSAGTLAYAIESVFAQRFDDFELILLNDGSTDRSREIAERYLSDPRARLIDDGRNLGLAPRLNEIAGMATGRYLARMDADDIMHPCRLGRQFEHLEEAPQVDLLGTGVYLIDAQYRIVGRRITPTIRLCEKFSYLQLFHPTVMGRTDWFRRNPYSSNFLRCEDAELWIRAGGGSNIAHLDEPLLYYNRHIGFELEKTLRSLKQYEQILALHHHRTCVACRIKHTITAKLKRTAYRVLVTTGLIGPFLALNGSQLSRCDQQSAYDPLYGVRARADMTTPGGSAGLTFDVPRRPAVTTVFPAQEYGSAKSFDPPSRFPELAAGTGLGDNAAYTSVRELFHYLGLDGEFYGSAGWNPLGGWIRPGMRVVVKPNWVKHESGSLKGQQVVSTHGSVLRAIIDYALIALKGQGVVSVADSPLQGADFGRLRQQSGIEDLEAHYRSRGAAVEFLDLRMEWAEIDDESGFIKRQHRLSGDPNGYSLIDIGRSSRLSEIYTPDARFGVTDYNHRVTNQHHDGFRNRYCISNTVLSADVLINVPKLKTHIKTGITCALKNMIGINCSKDYLPHFRAGCPSAGGDEYPDGSRMNALASGGRRVLQSRVPLWMWRGLRRVILFAPNAGSGPGSQDRFVQGGGWHGNDTLWRTIHDVVHIALNYGSNGVKLVKPRPMLTLVDAIVAGEGSGPLIPQPKQYGALIWGEDPGSIDVVCATLMGFDWKKIPMLAHLVDPEARAITGFEGVAEMTTPSSALRRSMESGEDRFVAPAGWVGEIEREESGACVAV